MNGSCLLPILLGAIRLCCCSQPQDACIFRSVFSEAKHHFPAATAFNLLSVLLAPCHCACAFLSMSSAAVKQAYKELKAYVCDRAHMTAVELCRNARKEMKEAQWRILFEFEKARMGAAFSKKHWKQQLIIHLAPERFPHGGDRVSQNWRIHHHANLVQFVENRILSSGFCHCRANGNLRFLLYLSNKKGRLLKNNRPYPNKRHFILW